MIEHHQGYTAIKRYGRNSFRTAGKHPFKIIHNAQVVKYDLIQQFESSTGIISYPMELKAPYVRN
jgi:hypothetical protein